MQKLGKILKIVLIVAIIAVIALLAVNMIKSNHKELEELTITENLKKAYANSSDLRTHSPTDEGFSPNGGLYAYSLVYIEKEGYLQLTVRYNTRHMDDIANTYHDFDESKIHYTLTDNKGNTYTPEIVDKASKYHYEYFKLEFTNVDFTDTELTLNMIIDVLSEVIGDKNSVVLHKSGEQSLPYQLNGEEGSAISTELVTK